MSEKNVLIVDDEAMILEMLARAFTKRGYNVFTAPGAEKALEILKQQSIPVIFMDLSMPGVNGLELCRQVHRENPIAVIFAVTGFASVFELADCREAGFEDYFTKPVDLAVLFKAAESAFEKIGRWKKR